MIDLLQYITRRTLGPIMESKASPTSDNAIYFKIGEHKYKWKIKLAPEKKQSLDRKYDISSNYRQGIIRLAKDTSIPILPDKDEVIHRKDWDLDGLIGETEYQLMHPHYWTLNEWILKTHKKKHDVLTIFECSNSKPYSKQKVRETFYMNWYRAFSDMACISNPGVVPMEYSHFYPYRYDEWNHFAEKPDIAQKYTWVCAARFITFVKKMGYKDVVVVFQSRRPQEWAEWMYKENIENCQSWLHIVNDERHYKDFLERASRKFKTHALAIQRLGSMPFFVDRYAKLLKDCLNAEDKKEFDRVQKIKNMDRGKERDEALAQFNKDHDIHPYDIKHGTSDNPPLMTPDSATTKEKVAKYKKYVEEQLDGIEDRYEEAKEDKTWHKHRVVFTPLDFLQDINDRKLIDDPDTEYWNMYKAVEEAIKDKKIHQLNSYCYAYEGLVSDLGLEDVKKYCNKLGITQFWDERRRSPDK